MVFNFLAKEYRLVTKWDEEKTLAGSTLARGAGRGLTLAGD